VPSPKTLLISPQAPWACLEPLALALLFVTPQARAPCPNATPRCASLAASTLREPRGARGRAACLTRGAAPQIHLITEYVFDRPDVCREARARERPRRRAAGHKVAGGYRS
jgi:hypothetical protein